MPVNPAVFSSTEPALSEQTKTDVPERRSTERKNVNGNNTKRSKKSEESTQASDRAVSKVNKRGERTALPAVVRLSVGPFLSSSAVLCVGCVGNPTHIQQSF